MTDTTQRKLDKKNNPSEKDKITPPTTNDLPNGVRNALFLLCLVVLTRELMYEYKMLNILNVFKLVQVHNVPMACVMFILLVIRSLVVYFSRNWYILYISEIAFHILINFQFRGVTALNVAIITMATAMKLHSFLKEIPEIEKNTKKPASENNQPNVNDESQNYSAMTESKKASEYPHDLKKDDCEEFSISVWFFIRYMFSPSFIFSNKYPTNGRSVLRLIFSIICLVSSFAVFNLFAGMYFLPAVFYFQPEATLYGFVQYLKLVYSSFIFWILSFFLLFECFPRFLSEITDIAVPTHGAWWNCNTFGEFWRDWNVQTHLWLKKYVFGFLLKKLHPILASFTTFLISGLVHELLIFFLIGKVKGVAFITILLQYLFISAENSIPFMNNMLFWILFCFIGQPCAMIAMGSDLWRCLS